MALIFCAYHLIDNLTEKPRYVKPKVIANGLKYYPNPWYPDQPRKEVPKFLKELNQYEKVNLP